MYTLSDNRYNYLLECINWYELKKVDVVETDCEEDITIRSIAFGKLRYCGRIKSEFDKKIEYSQNNRKRYLIKLEEHDY